MGEHGRVPSGSRIVVDSSRLKNNGRRQNQDLKDILNGPVDAGAAPLAVGSGWNPANQQEEDFIQQIQMRQQARMGKSSANAMSIKNDSDTYQSVKLFQINEIGEYVQDNYNTCQEVDHTPQLLANTKKHISKQIKHHQGHSKEPSRSNQS